MILWLLRKYHQYWCDHPAVKTEPYELFGGGTYWDGRGEYRPYFEGEEHTCQKCAKSWVGEVTQYRYYIDRDRDLIEKVEAEP